MYLDAWLTYYRSLPGHTIAVEEDGSEYAWMVYDEAGELVDWWWLYEANETREIGDDGRPKREAGK